MAQRKDRVGTTIREALHARIRVLLARRGDRTTNVQDVVDEGAEIWLEREEKKDASQSPSAA